MDEASAGASRRRGHWTPGEDEKLRQLVEQYGPQNWNSIAAKLQGRSGKSCRFRWFNHLDPSLNRRPFSEEEEDNVRLFGKRRSHNFISSSPGDITMSNFLTKPSTYEEAADTINSGLCKEIAAGLQKFRVMNSHSEEPEESCTMHKNVGFIDFLGVGT
ncbi:transcription factor MYB10-like isoform X1 [Nymphaea colorata]|nr:transcription factor MYB10-like isoform X1 [Nymphaea colorata]